MPPLRTTQPQRDTIAAALLRAAGRLNRLKIINQREDIIALKETYGDDAVNTIFLALVSLGYIARFGETQGARYQRTAKGERALVEYEKD